MQCNAFVSVFLSRLLGHYINHWRGCLCFGAWDKAVGPDIDDPVELNTAEAVGNDAAAAAARSM